MKFIESNLPIFMVSFLLVTHLSACNQSTPSVEAIGPTSAQARTVASVDPGNASESGLPAEYTVKYTTAYGSRPDGRYGYFPPQGESTPKRQAEAEVKALLQNVFNTSMEYVNSELNEVSIFVGNPCIEGYEVKPGLGIIKVLAVRQGANYHSYDYDLLLTCVETL